MPTPLMPDEEFDAQFRQGLEHYPEQPESPAAWHRMALLLDADDRQQALRRKVLRLLAAETLLLLLGVWATLSFVVGSLPASGPTGNVLATTRSRALVTRATSAGRTRAATATTRSAAEALSKEKLAGAATRAVLPQSAASAARHGRPAIGPARRATSLAAPGQPWALARVALPHRTRRVAGSPGVAALVPTERNTQLGVGTQSREIKHYFSGVYTRMSVRDNTAATAASRPQRRQGATLLEKRRPAQAGAVAGTRQPLPGSPTAAAYSPLGAAEQRLAFGPSRRLRRPAEARRQGALAAIPRPVAAAKYPRSAAEARRQYLPAERGAVAGRTRRAATPAGPAAGEAALPIGLLAPRLSLLVSDLPFSLPDSLALLALALPARPADSLTTPKPTPALVAYRLRLGVGAAPDFSTVRADRLTAPGINLGVQLDYQLARRWRLSTAYLYTVKRYVALGTDYHLPAGYTLPHNWVISDVDAVCRIIDIPINLRYDLWQRPSYQVFASVGLSSLLMRREQYTYNYEPANGQPVPAYDWQLNNGSQHYFKILNLSAGYERAVGQRWTVQAEPFVKVPLAGVGFGAVRLSSAGVFFSLKYGLRPLHPASAPAPH